MRPGLPLVLAFWAVSHVAAAEPPQSAASPVADAGTAPQSAVPDPGTTPALVVAEAPYKLGERPRADGPVVASVADEEVSRWNAGGTSDPLHVSNRAGFHAATRVVVDTRVSSGRLPARAIKGALSRTALLAQARSHGYWPFRLCFEEGARREALSGGKTQIRLTIGRSGRVTASRLLETELDPETARCLVAKGRALRFSPGPASRIGVDVTVDIGRGDGLLPDGRLTHDKAPDPGSGRLDARVFGETVAAVPGQIAECYERAMARDPGIWGRLSLRIDLDGQGRIRGVEQHDSRFPAKDVVACAFDAVRTIRFPENVGGGGPLSVVWAVRLGAPPKVGTRPIPVAGPEKSSVAEARPLEVSVPK